MDSRNNSILPEVRKGSIPKTIWAYWHSGYGQAPEIVRTCLNSWAVLNPEYELILVDQTNLSELTDLPDSVRGWAQLSHQMQSDLLRLDLLDKRGGIWVDATLFCAVPISKWMTERPHTGCIFAPATQGSDKLIASFFLSSVPGGRFVSSWNRIARSYFDAAPQAMSNKLLKRLTKAMPIVRGPIGRIFFTMRAAALRWGAPYFIIHYLATRLILSSPRHMVIWLRAPKITGGRYSTLVRTNETAKKFAEMLARQESPFWKLTHKPQPDRATYLEEISEVCSHYVSTVQASENTNRNVS